MNCTCPKCHSRYEVADELGGRLGYCGKCESDFVLPIPDANRLLSWANEAPWHRLQRFIQHEAARGHEQAVIERLIQIVEQRRWIEEAKVHHEIAQKKSMRALTQREKAWARSETILNQRRTLDELRRYTPEEFERFVACLFEYQGYKARAVGKTCDSGVDVEVRDQQAHLWAVVQCKRYSAASRVTAAQIRDFAGAYMISGATRGFIFTTGSLTSQAARTAASLKWLTVTRGLELIRYIEAVTPDVGRT